MEKVISQDIIRCNPKTQNTMRKFLHIINIVDCALFLQTFLSVAH